MTNAIKSHSMLLHRRILQGYRRWRQRRLLAASNLFDTGWYLTRYPDVRDAGQDALFHYVRCGATERRSPHPLFDSAWYLHQNPDVRASGQDPLIHYLLHGAAEGRSPHPLFDVAWYLDQYPDVRASRQNPLAHYLAHRAGTHEPHPLFDATWYLHQNPDVRASGQDPLVHYLSFGAAEGRSPHPLFDAAWYLGQYPEVRADGGNPLLHYLLVGAAEGRSPHPLFHAAWYLDQYPEVRAAGLNPLLHYVLVWALSDHKTNQSSVTTRYLSQLPRQHATAIKYYLQPGANDLRPSQLFDPAYYRKTYPDAGLMRMDPLGHYCLFGSAERRNPSAEFHTRVYLDQLSPDTHCADALAHYYQVGRSIGLPFNERQAREQLILHFANGLPTTLAILHDLGGGSDKHVRDIAALCEGQINTLVMVPGYDGTVLLSGPRANRAPRLRLNPQAQSAELMAVLRECNVARVHIHHCLGHESYLRSFMSALALPFDLTIHDYYLISPQPHLIGEDGRFVGEELFAAESELLKAAYENSRTPSLEAWQRQHRWLFTDAARVIVPSHDVARRINTFIPKRSLIVAAHPGSDFKIYAPMRPPRCESAMNLRIVVLGDITPHKGCAVVLSCARLAKTNNYPIEFHVIGYSHAHAQLLDAGVSVTGPYLRDDLPRFIEERDPHLIWYPSQCPETFSYTLSEGFMAKRPLVVVDIGALPERVGGRSWVWIRPWDQTPDEWIAFFLSIREQNFLKSIAPMTVGRASEVTDQFYKSDYLNWAQRPSTRQT